MGRLRRVEGARGHDAVPPRAARGSFPGRREPLHSGSRDRPRFLRRRARPRLHPRLRGVGLDVPVHQDRGRGDPALPPGRRPVLDRRRGAYGAVPGDRQAAPRRRRHLRAGGAGGDPAPGDRERPPERQRDEPRFGPRGAPRHDVPDLDDAPGPLRPPRRAARARRLGGPGRLARGGRDPRPSLRVGGRVVVGRRRRRARRLDDVGGRHRLRPEGALGDRSLRRERRGDPGRRAPHAGRPPRDRARPAGGVERRRLARGRLPRRHGVARRVHRLRLPDRARLEQQGGDVRVREPRGRRAPGMVGPGRGGDRAAGDRGRYDPGGAAARLRRAGAGATAGEAPAEAVPAAPHEP